MKRMLMLMMVFALAITIRGCSDMKYSTTKNGTEYTIDKSSCTITDGENTYKYLISASETNTSIEITYPDGSKWWCDNVTAKEQNKTILFGGKSDDYDETKYVSGEILKELIEDTNNDRDLGKKVVVPILFFALGVLILAHPKILWIVLGGWTKKETQPTDTTVMIYRIFGILFIITAIIMVGA